MKYLQITTSKLIDFQNLLSFIVKEDNVKDIFIDINKTLNTVDSTIINNFPISGRDLIKIGADTKLLGLYIDILKKEWFESGCLLTKSNLIDKYKQIFDNK